MWVSPGTNPPASSPRFNSVKMSGNALQLTGSNGTPNQTYHVLAATNMYQPASNWNVIATNTFDGSGRFTNEASAAGSSQMFYRLKL